MTDTELPILSENKKRIEEITGSLVLVSSSEVVRICENKTVTHDFLGKNGFSVPKLYSEGELDSEDSLKFPLFIKPQVGGSSANARRVDNISQLRFFRDNTPNYMVQECIVGQEYTVDVFSDLESNVITVVPRLRMAVCGGEILYGRGVKDRAIIDDVKRLTEALKPVGHIGVQLIKNNDGFFYTEINARLSGGSPMSILSGANACENIYRILNNERLQYNEEYRDDLVLMRFDDCVCVDKDGNIC
jgi:carbamoyl-phosphate synthase large subunit